MVFRFAADVENQPKWLLSVAQARRLSGHPGEVGSVYAQSIREKDGLSAYELEIIDVEPGERFVYQSQADGPPVRVEYTFADAEGGTEVELSFHIRVGPFFSVLWPLAIALRRGGGRQVAVVLERLKMSLEGEGAPRP